MKLLIITRKIDSEDSRMGFFVNWIICLSQKIERIYVITWQESQRSQHLPENVILQTLTGNKLIKILRLQKHLIKILPKVDGLFCHMNPEYTIIAAPLAKLFRKKIVSWYTHKEITFKRRLMELLADSILTASDKSFRGPLFPKKVYATGHGIDTEMFSFRERNDFEVPLRLLSIGRISPTKDIESMVKAIDILKKRGVTGIELNIIGEPALKHDWIYYENLKRMAEKMKLKNMVKFLGSKSFKDTPFFYKEADLFLNLSYTGSLDKAVLEAMAAGCLVLTSNEAFRNILPTELMIEKDNPEKLAEKIKWLMTLPKETANQLRRRFRREVVENHNLDNLISTILNEFNPSKN